MDGHGASRTVQGIETNKQLENLNCRRLERHSATATWRQKSHKNIQGSKSLVHAVTVVALSKVGPVNVDGWSVMKSRWPAGSNGDGQSGVDVRQLALVRFILGMADTDSAGEGAFGLLRKRGKRGNTGGWPNSHFAMVMNPPLSTTCTFYPSRGSG